MLNIFSQLKTPIVVCEIFTCNSSNHSYCMASSIVFAQISRGFHIALLVCFLSRMRITCTISKSLNKWLKSNGINMQPEEPVVMEMTRKSATFLATLFIPSSSSSNNIAQWSTPGNQKQKNSKL
jgi:hypothetical protein